MLTMVEIAGSLGWVSAALLFAALAAWIKLGPRLLHQRLDGRATMKTEPVEIASRLLVLAVGLSAVAAILAVAGWISG